MSVAEKVTENLAQLTSQVTPGDVSSVYGIRKAMGISLPTEPTEGTFTHLTTGIHTHTQFFQQLNVSLYYVHLLFQYLKTKSFPPVVLSRSRFTLLNLKSSFCINEAVSRSVLIKTLG